MNILIRRVLPIVIAVALTVFVTSIIYQGKIKNAIYEKNIEVASLSEKVASYEESYTDVLKLDEYYTSEIGDLFTLLYNSPYPGSSLESLSEDPYLKLQTLVSNIDRNVGAIDDIKHFLVSRESFINSFPFTWPLSVKDGVPEITSAFGPRTNSILGNIGGSNGDGLHNHAGIDLNLEIGDPVSTTADGRVVQIWDTNTYLGEHEVYGKLIIIKHDYGFKTYYAHLSEVSVTVGQYVERGQLIGYGGDTGQSQGAHLHYEVRLNNVAWDPMIFLGMTH